jgi:hypothetical protein
MARSPSRGTPPRVDPAVPQLDAGQGVVLVNLLGDVPLVDHVALIPQARRVGRRLIGLRMDGAELCAHRPPSALGAHTAVGRVSPGTLRSQTTPVRAHPEAVAHGLRAERDGLEQRVVLGIAHTCLSSVQAIDGRPPPWPRGSRPPTTLSRGAGLQYWPQPSPAARRQFRDRRVLARRLSRSRTTSRR